MALLSTQQIVIGGLNPAFQAAAAGGDTFKQSGRTYLHVKNGDASAHTVTINSVQSCDQGFDHDIAVNVPAGGERLLGPFGDRFRNVDGEVEATYDAITSVTVAAFQIP